MRGAHHRKLRDEGAVWERTPRVRERPHQLLVRRVKLRKVRLGFELPPRLKTKQHVQLTSISEALRLWQ